MSRLGKNAQPTLCNLFDYAGAHCSSLHSSICYRKACISQNNCFYEFRSAHSTANPLPSKLVVRIYEHFAQKKHSTCYDHTGRYNCKLASSLRIDNNWFDIFRALTCMQKTFLRKNEQLHS